MVKDVPENSGRKSSEIGNAVMTTKLAGVIGLDLETSLHEEKESQIFVNMPHPMLTLWVESIEGEDGNALLTGWDSLNSHISGSKQLKIQGYPLGMLLPFFLFCFSTHTTPPSST